MVPRGSSSSKACSSKSRLTQRISLGPDLHQGFRVVVVRVIVSVCATVQCRTPDRVTCNLTGSPAS
jgi:hypothetical protein